MDCPTCETELVNEKYEGHNVFQCPDCSGYLIKRQRMAQIKDTRETSSAELESHATARAAEDRTDLIRCPRCRVQRMNKQRIHFDERPDESFMIDICGKCQMVWFDGGELAKLQIDHESSIKAIDQLERQQLAQNLGSERKQELEQRIAALPTGAGGIGSQILGLWPWIPCAVFLMIAAFAWFVPGLTDAANKVNYPLVIGAGLIGIGCGAFGFRRH